MPTLSVVMPVHNALPFLDRSIESILGQTYGDFELIVRDDGSSDGSGEALHDWARRDARIRVVHGAQLGPAGSSNWVVRAATGDIVARMDADDVARPDRLAVQMAVMARYPDTVLVGSIYDTIDVAGALVRRADRLAAVSHAMFAPFVHTSVMIRRAAFERVGGYRAVCDYWEDTDLFLRLAQLGPVRVVNEPLVQYRVSSNSTRLTSHIEAVDRAMDTMFRCMSLYDHGHNYEACLHDATRADPARRLMPATYIARGSTRLWAHQHPRILVPLLARARLRWNAISVVALLWACWAAASPASLRGAIGVRRWLRASLHRHRHRSIDIAAWQPGRCRRNRGPN